ncbi:transcriptional regulator family: GATA type zinc finger [Penicillium verrucosum]|uniref:transcriptional regulator family: GATA type zinc finger n=1 Tax=Penicillium verrucosum TaxID=60171 RepID=UPI002544D697|nr:transcriptional regulator family: GATA type zinc finger [Penicillium verrucosum]KAJ5943568.1 transcriptional regulator family: GATA type zinc finger [Penicillium verrucosum]
MVDTGAIVIPIVIIAPIDSESCSEFVVPNHIRRATRLIHTVSPSIRSKAGFQLTPTSPLHRGFHPLSGREFPYDLSAENPSARHASNGSIPFSTTLPDIKSVTKFGSGESDGYPGSSVSTSLPGLAALASVASAPTSNLRCVDTPYRF